MCKHSDQLSADGRDETIFCEDVVGTMIGEGITAGRFVENGLPVESFDEVPYVARLLELDSYRAEFYSLINQRLDQASSRLIEFRDEVDKFELNWLENNLSKVLDDYKSTNGASFEEIGFTRYGKRITLLNKLTQFHLLMETPCFAREIIFHIDQLSNIDKPLIDFRSRISEFTSAVLNSADRAKHVVVSDQFELRRKLSKKTAAVS